MPVTIVRGDITRIAADAIVNAANSSLLGGGGVDGAIHRAAGPELLAECRTLGGCPTGEARITKGYNLPCRYVIHTVGPVWKGGSKGEPELLASCYRSSLELAAKNGCRSVAFPLISAGVYGYPKADALRIAMDTIRSCAHEDMDVQMVIFDRSPALIDGDLYDSIHGYVEDRYTLGQFMKSVRSEAIHMVHYNCSFACADSDSMADGAAAPGMIEEALSDDLDRRIGQLDESFSQSLLRLISLSGMSDAQCYKRANIDRKLFSKIRSDVHYRPSKATALAFAIALELDLEQTGQLLRKAGYALSPSSKFDVIVEYFIEHRQYNIMRINEALFAFDQPLLAG